MTTQVNDVRSGRRIGRPLVRTAAALVALCSLTAGCGFSWAEDMGVAWDTPVDRKGETQGNGAWLSGDTLVHSRFDAVRGYDASSGARRWEYVPPGRSAVCHAAADTDGSVLILTRDADGASALAKGEPCATAVAIDMKNGRELWQAPDAATDRGLDRFRPSSVSAGGGIAVLVKKDGLHAVDVRTGKSRWKAALPQGCVPGRTAVAERQVAALLACGSTGTQQEDEFPEGAELHAAAFAPATGALLWSAPLGGRSAIRWDTRVEFVSADPLVVAASDSGDSNSGAYVSFGRNGRPNPPIDFSGSYGEIELSDRLTAAVDDSRLYVVPNHTVRISRHEYRLTAFDLATGEPVWGGTRDDDRLDGDVGDQFLLQDGKLTVLAWGDHARLHVLDPATGDQHDVYDLPEELDGADEIFGYKDRLIVARYGDQAEPSRPFTAYKRL
ncbi:MULTISPECIES: PQQ-binding-like beta-propeller repeat protein [unclassified Streptomyces]|uniref:outer membrane protein assembly factor BamB family protein n=1 Tax=unclassified Streptomyces TaxID=2593676 RepID=UPI0036AB1AB6